MLQKLLQTMGNGMRVKDTRPEWFPWIIRPAAAAEPAYTSIFQNLLQTMANGMRVSEMRSEGVLKK